MTRLSFEPLISPTLWVSLALLSGGLLIWYAWSRPASVPRRRWRVIIALMSAGISSVLAVLLNPTWLEAIPPPAGKPLLTVLVDRSASMATNDAQDGRTRFQAAAEIATGISKRLTDRFDVRVRTFAGSTSPREAEELATTDPDGQSTNLARAITESLEDDRPQGQALLVLSDGIHNAPGGVDMLLDVVRTAKAMAAPIYTTTLGGEGNVRDLEVTLGRPQELAFVGQSVPVQVLIRQRGLLTDRADVTMLRDGKEIARQEAQLTVGGTASVTFDLAGTESGLYRYEARVSALNGEATSANNSATLLLRVVKDPIRVLLLEGKPYWDAKFLMRTLASDGALEIDGVVRLKQGRFLKRTLRLSTETESIVTDRGEESPAAPIAQRVENTVFLTDPSTLLDGKDSLESYQVVVLGRDSERFLDKSMLERLRNWISRDGGSLVCYRGSPVAQVSQELGRLLPVRWTPTRESRFRMQLTGRGADLNWFGAASQENEMEVLGKLPSLATAAKSEQPGPLAVVLARSEGDDGPPVVTYQPYGTGRVVTVDGAGMWRWAFLPPAYQAHETVYGSLWQSLVRWLVSSVGLVPGRDIVLRGERVGYTTGESASAILLTREGITEDKLPPVELRDSDNKSLKTVAPVPFGDEPGIYQVVFGQLPEGHYRARLADAAITDEDSATTVAFDVRPFLGEQLDVAARPDILARIATDSEGAVLDGGDASAVADEFDEHISRSRRERVRRLTAWDRWWVLLAVFTLWGVSWATRRAGGLI